MCILGQKAVFLWFFDKNYKTVVVVVVVFFLAAGYAEISSSGIWLNQLAPDFNSGWCKCVFIFLITGSCWPPDSNFTITKCTSVQYSQIFFLWKNEKTKQNKTKQKKKNENKQTNKQKRVLLAFLVQNESFWNSLWRILQYNLLLLAYFDHSILGLFKRTPLQIEEHFIKWPLDNISNFSFWLNLIYQVRIDC